MTRDLDKNCNTTVVRSREALPVTSAALTCARDARVSLFVILIGIALDIQISGKIGDRNVHRYGFFAQAADLAVNLGLSTGMSLRVGVIAILLFGVFAPYPALAGHKLGVFRAGLHSNHRETFDSTSRPRGLGPVIPCTETDTNVGAIFVGSGCGGQSDGEPRPRYHQ